MSNGVILVEAPSSCDECDFIEKGNRHDYCGIPGIGEVVDDFIVSRPRWCPIIECEEIVIRMGNNNDKSNS